MSSSTASTPLQERIPLGLLRFTKHAFITRADYGYLKLVVKANFKSSAVEYLTKCYFTTLEHSIIDYYESKKDYDKLGELLQKQGEGIFKAHLKELVEIQYTTFQKELKTTKA